MGADTKIEWTATRLPDGTVLAGYTFNPWIGCAKVSPGCLHCYAETQDNHRGWTAEGWGKGKPRKHTSVAYWREPLKWNGEAEASGIRRKVFCASLADWLDAEVPIEWLAELLDLIRQTPHLDWLLLSKRPENWSVRMGEVKHYCTTRAHLMDLYRWVGEWMLGNPPLNVWIGTTAEDQARYDERIAHLCLIPALYRFLSMEPLLSAVDMQLHANLPGERMLRWHRPVKGMLHWVIVGGESGPGARPMHPDWARSLRDQCAKAGVPFFFKQWGEYLPVGQFLPNHGKITGGTAAKKGLKLHYAGGAHAYEDGVAFAETPDGRLTFRVGKVAAGRLLDGREWNETPEGRAA
ncbi:MAG: hypothetical protein K0R17_3554 [Rariglobus sp.]|jgi:protein gp37|nr:hypothetical protein [Rariglobus sp.]